MGHIPKKIQALDYGSDAGHSYRQRRRWFRLAVTTAGFSIFGIGWWYLSLQSMRDGPGYIPTLCSSNLRQIGICLLDYAVYHEGKFPTNMPQTVRSMIKPDASIVLTCPEIPASGGTSYIYIPGQGAYGQPSQNVLVYEPANSHDGKWANVLFADGHVQRMTAADLNAAIARTMASLAAKTATQPASAPPAP